MISCTAKILTNAWQQESVENKSEYQNKEISYRNFFICWNVQKALQEIVGFSNIYKKHTIFERSMDLVAKVCWKEEEGLSSISETCNAFHKDENMVKIILDPIRIEMFQCHLQKKPRIFFFTQMQPWNPIILEKQ